MMVRVTMRDGKEIWWKEYGEGSPRVSMDVGGLAGVSGMGVYGLMCDRYIRRVGFEPTRSKTPELEAGPLDLSGKVA